MKKRILLSFMVLMVLIQSVIIQPQQASAVGADTVLKLVGGKAIVRALAEKTGVAMSKKQLDNVAGYIEKKTYDGDQNAIDFVNKANNAVSSGASERSGFKKYVLDPLFWLAGVDLIIGAYDAFRDGYNSGSPVPIYQQCTNPVLNVNSTYKYIVVEDASHWWIFEVRAGEVEYVSDNGSSFAIRATKDGSAFYPYTQSKASYPVPNFTGTKTTLSQKTGLAIGYGGSYTSTTYNALKYAFYGSCVQDKQIQAEDIPNMMNVTNNTYNQFHNDTYNTGTIYNLDIELPDIINYDDTTPWNTIDENIDKEIGQSEVIDDDNPYVDNPNDPTDDPPAGSKWWEWLLGPLKAIGDFFKDVGGFLLGILVPSADSVTGIFNGISDSFKAKIPIADQLGSFFGEIEEIQATETPTAPTFDVTMPVEWGGGTFPMIDFSYFDQWRNWVLNFIRFTAWFIFLKRLYARVPRMIY